MANSKLPLRRSLNRRPGERHDTRVDSMPAPLRAETIPRRGGIGPAVHLVTLEADLAREKAERAADADRLGEMLMRVAAVEAERRTLAIQLLAATERARSLEAELDRVHEDMNEHRSRALAAIRAREAEVPQARQEAAAALARAEADRQAAELARDRALDAANDRAREATELHARVLRAENEVSRLALDLEAAETAAADEVARVCREGALALEAIRAALSATDRALGQVLGLAPSAAAARVEATSVKTDPRDALTRRPDAAATAFAQGGLAPRASRSSRPAGAARAKAGSDAPRSRSRIP